MKKKLLLLLLVCISTPIFAQTAETIIEQSDKYATEHLHIKYEYELMTLDGVLYATNKYERTPCVLIRYPSAKTQSSFTIPTGVTRICAHAFDGAKLETLYIPNTVRYIAYEAFTNAQIGRFESDNNQSAAVQPLTFDAETEAIYDAEGKLQDSISDPAKTYIIRLKNGQALKVRGSK